MWWFTKVVQASVRSEWRKDLNLSIEKIARMRDFSIQCGVQGVLTLVTGVCGIFLFSMMGADNTDGRIEAVGYTGLASIIAVLISEIYSSLKAQERRSRESESGQIEEERVTLSEEPVEEVSWVFVGVSFLFTLTFTELCVFYAVALEVKYWFIACLILPIAALSWVMAFFYKPKRTDAGYLRFLYFHFLTFVVVGLVSFAVGSFRLGNSVQTSSGLFALFLIPLWCLGFWLGLKLRASAAKLPPQELSAFLCQTVLVKGTGVIGPMVFFTFETVSCLTSRNMIGESQCRNTSTAAMFLSFYLALLTILSIINKVVPEGVQREMAVEISSIASLKGLKWWQRLQGGLITITAIISLNLLSILGVEGDENSMVGIVGATGLLSIGFALLINATMLILTKKEQGNLADTIHENAFRSKRTFSSAVNDVEDDALVMTVL
ncbi:hypothetical protein TrST_g1471 [Triparma strigata]|uniref:Uncharacterized protein n=1 Tax=Triparma strigata TaxID=1606541 RepID=A0A9W7AL24_9STRA|nr:hypothetical protein TrST_g1471 [Triparma strigata]